MRKGREAGFGMENGGGKEGRESEGILGREERGFLKIISRFDLLLLVDSITSTDI